MFTARETASLGGGQSLLLSIGSKKPVYSTQTSIAGGQFRLPPVLALSKEV